MAEQQYVRRRYHLEDPDGTLEKAKRIQLIVQVDGKKFIDVPLREPGMLAIVSKPNESGLDIEIVEPGTTRYTDVQTLEAVSEQRPTEWQQLALGMKSGV